MKSNFFLVILLYSLVFSNSYNNIYDENIHVYLDPFDINTFSLNRFFPNLNDDISYYSIKFDGSTFIPLSEVMPSKIHFNLNEGGTISQLIYNQRKSDDYFDTSIALKNDIYDDTQMLLQLETKSIVDNINQNFFLNYNKNRENYKLDFSYMYNYGEDPENFDILSGNDSFFKEIENYNLGFSIEYAFDNLKFYSSSSSQISSSKRPEASFGDYSYIDYESQVFWNNSKFEYIFNENFSAFLSSLFKKNITESSQEYLNGYKEEIRSIGLKVNKGSIFLNIGGDYLDKEFEPYLATGYGGEYVNINISANNSFASYIVDSDILYGHYQQYKLKKYNFNITFDFKNNYNSLDVGSIENEVFNYNYYLLNGYFDLNKIKLDYKYYNYLNIEGVGLNLSEYINYGISYYPFKNKYKFELYGKLSYNQYNLNSNIDLLSLNPFYNQNIDDKNVSLYNSEIGFIFDSFTILYKSKNVLNDEVVFSDSINPFQRLDYINIIWIFND